MLTRIRFEGVGRRDELATEFRKAAADLLKPGYGTIGDEHYEPNDDDPRYPDKGRLIVHLSAS